jgi:hypothetical protein
VVAFSDIPEGNAAAMHIGGIDHCAGYGRATRLHGRAQACAADLPSAFLPVIIRVVVNQRTLVGIGIHRNIWGGAFTGVIGLK